MTVPSRRITKLALAVSIAFTTATAGTVPAVAAPYGGAGAWTHDGFDAGNSGYNPAETIVNAGSIGGVRQRWSVRPAAGAEGCAPALPPPLVAGGRVYVLDGEGVTALDAATGQRLWRDPKVLDALDFRQLVVSDGMLVVAGTSCYANSDPDGYVVALDAATGARRWKVTQEPPVNALVVDAGTVVTSGWASATNEDSVIAYDSRNGTRRWSRTGAVLAGPVSSGGRVLLHDAKGTTAVTVTAGAVLWRAAVRWAPLAATGDRFFAVPDPVAQGDLHGLAALRAGSGAVAWKQAASVDSVATDGRRVYAATGSTVTAFNAGKGSRLWSRALPGAAQRPVRAGGLLYVAVQDRPVAVLSPVTGRDVPGAARLEGAIDHVVVSGGRLYTTDGSTLRAYTP